MRPGTQKADARVEGEMPASISLFAAAAKPEAREASSPRRTKRDSSAPPGNASACSAPTVVSPGASTLGGRREKKSSEMALNGSEGRVWRMCSTAEASAAWTVLLSSEGAN